VLNRFGVWILKKLTGWKKQLYGLVRFGHWICLFIFRLSFWWQDLQCILYHVSRDTTPWVTWRFFIYAFGWRCGLIVTKDHITCLIGCTPRNMSPSLSFSVFISLVARLKLCLHHLIHCLYLIGCTPRNMSPSPHSLSLSHWLHA